MEPFIIKMLLPVTSGVLFVAQAIYHLGIYRQIHTHNQETGTTGSDSAYPPLSVIIVAKDVVYDLQKNLPLILEQDYPEFEVIVVHDSMADDCDDALKLLEDKYSHLYHTFIPDSARYISHKKLGITMGIKASRYDWLVFTESNCYPLSNQWLKQMARNFTPATEIVLGYSNYEKASGWFNKKIIFDTLLNSMRYLGMAIAGHPYTGSGCNLAYRKSLYYKQKGFASHLNLQRGEDDIFINETANGSNTRVETSAESIMLISAPKDKHLWREEKINYITTSNFYKGFSRYLMGFETCSRLLFYMVTISTLLISCFTQQWIVTILVTMLWTLRFIIQLSVFHQTSKDMQTHHYYLLLPVFDILQPLWNYTFRVKQRLRRKGDFLRK